MVDKLRKSVLRLLEDIWTVRFIILTLVVYGVITESLFHTVCPFRIITGFPCPGCGLTHGCIYILTGRWKLAAEYNLAAFLWIPFILYLLICRYWLDIRAKYWILASIIVCLLTMAVYVRTIVQLMV